MRGQLIILTIALIVICVAIFSLAQRTIHNFEGLCALCHLVKGEEVFEGIFVKKMNFQCKYCHDDLGFSHPTGMKPTMTMPEGFPLNSSRRMTCATCHETHGEKRYLLKKGQAGKSFCHLCHREGLENIHGGVGISTHSKKYEDKYEVTDRNIFVDGLSALCLSCHDSTLGRERNIGTGIFFRRSGGNHPIGVDYMKAYLKGGFVHPSRLHKNLRLYKGTVGCGTCHNMYSKERYKLVLNNEGSALCLACHRK